MSKTVIAAEEFINKLKTIQKNTKTVYCWGSFGFPVTADNIRRLAKQYPKIYTNDEQARLSGLIGQKYFSFDCVGLIKGVLWNWDGSLTSNGGAKYESNGVRDIDCNQMFDLCSNKSVNFNKIIPGEFLWRDGHIGVYIGDGLGIECTPSWNDGVQITAVGNIGAKTGYYTRNWTKHGQSPFIEYPQAQTNQNGSNLSIKKSGQYYYSAGVAGMRTEPDAKSMLKGRCERGKYYLAESIWKDGAGNEWFKHADSGLYSSLVDTATKDELFSLSGTYVEVKTNANCRIRSGAGTSKSIVTTVSPNQTIYWTGETVPANGYVWAKIIFDGKICYCDEQWLNT